MNQCREAGRRAAQSHHSGLIRTRVVTPAAFRTWTGRIDVISLGHLGHAAALVYPNRYVDVLERALA